jgi:hypothetical protein
MPFEREIIEARLALNLVASDDWPKLASDALEQGLDGPGIRRLAAFIQPTWSEVDQVLPNAIREMKLAPMAIGEAALLLAKRRAREILERGWDPLTHTREFEQLWIRAGYPQGLQPLGTLADEVSVARHMGRTEDEISSWVIQILAEQAKG